MCFPHFALCFAGTVRLLLMSARACQVDPIFESPKKLRPEEELQRFKILEEEKKKQEEKFAEEMEKKGSLDEQD